MGKVVICAIGADTVRNAMLDIWFMLLFWPLLSKLLLRLRGD